MWCSRATTAWPADGPGRQKKENEMADAPNPIQIQKHLSGVDYPASKQTLLETAKKEGADKDLLDALERIPDGDYDAPTAVSKAVSDNA
jgi:hypothetical protein